MTEDQFNIWLGTSSVFLCKHHVPFKFTCIKHPWNSQLHICLQVNHSTTLSFIHCRPQNMKNWLMKSYQFLQKYSISISNNVCFLWLHRKKLKLHPLKACDSYHLPWQGGTPHRLSVPGRYWSGRGRGFSFSLTRALLTNQAWTKSVASLRHKTQELPCKKY